MSKFLPSFLISFFYLALAFPAITYAQTTEIDEPDGYAPLTALETVFANVLNVVTVLAGFAVLLMLVIGAFRYMTSQGDPKAVGAARSTLTWALVGLFFIIAAWFVVLFVSQFTGLNLTTFCIDVNFNEINECQLQRR